MNKFLQNLKLLSVLVILLAAVDTKAQLNLTVNNGVNYECDQAGSNIVNISITSSPAGTTSYSWNVVSSPCAATFTTTSTSTVMSISAPCVGFYSVCCTAYNGATIVGVQCTAFDIYPNPNVTISNSNPSGVCAGSTFTLTGGGAMTYTWTAAPFMILNGSMIVQTPTANTCYTLMGADMNGCVGTATHCSNVLPLPSVTVAGNNTVCLGSSASFTASGALSYIWSNGTIGSTFNVIPTPPANFTVAGTDANGCVGNTAFMIVVDTACADVWPGDANSDGVVDNSDALELGLAFNDTGAPRVPGGNSFTSQHATTWTGYVSTGKNKCHADCNGDGTVNLLDTVAIYNNYSLTHAFKPSENSATPDISITSPEGVGASGWNFALITLGTASTPMNQIYGVAFDINYDKNLIETNAIGITYDNCFLNAGNQNVQFKKPVFNNGKLHVASVRVDGSNVTGSGQIAQFWFKVKNGVPANTVLNLSISNAKRINAAGTSAPLTGNSSGVTITTGLNELSAFENSIQVYPNPASNNVTIKSESSKETNYIVSDIAGRQVLKGAFMDSKTVNVSELSAGTYIVRLQSGGLISHKKLVIEK